MTRPGELEPLDCIIMAINTYRYAADDYKESINIETVAAQLDQHPSIQAWLIQRRLEASEQVRQFRIVFDLFSQSGLLRIGSVWPSFLSTPKIS